MPETLPEEPPATPPVPRRRWARDLLIGLGVLVAIAGVVSYSLRRWATGRTAARRAAEEVLDELLDQVGESRTTPEFKRFAAQAWRDHRLELLAAVFARLPDLPAEKWEQAGYTDGMNFKRFLFAKGPGYVPKQHPSWWRAWGELEDVLDFADEGLTREQIRDFSFARAVDGPRQERLLAVVCLTETGWFRKVPQGPEKILARLEQEPEPLIRRLCLHALSRDPGEVRQRALLRALRDESMLIESRAKTLLEELRASAAVGDFQDAAAIDRALDGR